MDKKNPTVYIVLTVYNGEKYFLEQLMSIYFQEYENRFLVIVDDGSTDSSYNIAKKFISDYNLGNKVKIIRQENKGTCKATEKGLIEVQKLGDEEDYVTYCDADDIWTRNKLGYLVEYMNNHKECELSFHDLSTIDQNGKIVLKSFTHSCMKNPYDNSFFELASVNHTSINLIYKVLYIKDIVPIENQGAKDYRTALSFSLNGRKMDYIDEILGYYRVGHPSIQRILLKNGILKRYERDFILFNKLKEKFPENKEIDYFIKYTKDKIKWIKKGDPKISILFLFICYPKWFFVILKKILKYYITIGYKIK